MYRISFFTVLGLLLFTSCGGKQLTENLKKVYSGSDTIEINTNYTVFDVSRRFSVELDTVLNDSRCPKGVQCVWEGNAEIQLKTTMSSDSKIHYIRLHTNSQFAQDTVVNNYRFKLLELNPYPENGKTFPYYDYRATIVIEKQ